MASRKWRKGVMRMEYRFTEDDLWAFLSARQDDEVVGVCGDGTACLVAEAMRAKYPQLSHSARPPAGVNVGIDGFLAVMQVWGMDEQHFLLSPGLYDVMRVFDCWTGKTLYESVTKAEFLRAWQRFQEENG
jgi:hypothetical protein